MSEKQQSLPFSELLKNTESVDFNTGLKTAEKLEKEGYFIYASGRQGVDQGEEVARIEEAYNQLSAEGHEIQIVKRDDQQLSEPIAVISILVKYRKDSLRDAEEKKRGHKQDHRVKLEERGYKPLLDEKGNPRRFFSKNPGDSKSFDQAVAELRSANKTYEIVDGFPTGTEILVQDGSIVSNIKGIAKEQGEKALKTIFGKLFGK